ncbi:hypothetical protein CONCODRAFT_12965 [Conidiobolus coronatus NRRL 28638]|uniref:RNI-like protein n=1 Tax=Conidiobolus coronatus (strain ATCC 28846 / CBS 209.66 / NRRL 28638) TaxID=796925 RepID=A0A137NRX8_CONC2|nr:hypothetical protein CONCODRAFT_12965 [Conidiobolus coronatus NRRL 28638]|eukprot:KXN65440.1 hypothetical protein CONCODRAFT_12965 [Conidiobolus coronatus NRRL 28638]
MQEIDKNNYTITWPLNLKKLIIGDSYIGFANYDNDFIATDRFGNFNQECDELSLEPKHLPNLHTLILQSIDPIHECFLGNGEKYFEFLKANCHIIKFDTSFYSLKPEFFEIISKFNNLTELKLSIHDVEDIESFKGFKLPVIANLKNSSLNLYRSLSILPIIAEQFPGIAKLNLTYDFQYYGDVEHIKSFPSEIQAFKSLKVLKLRIFVSYMLCNIDFSKLKYLKSLEILCKEAIEMGDFIRKLENYPDLNRESLSVIKFGEYQFYTKLDFELLLGFKHRPIFRHFPYRLMFYKFNK